MRFLATIVLGMSLMMSIGHLHAQSDVVALEYFIDSDPGFGQGTPINITAGTTVTLNDQLINTITLEDGFHTLYLRASNSNAVWGPYETRLIFVDRSVGFNDLVEISEVEYFIDTDPGLGQGTSLTVAGTPLSFSTSSLIDTDGLSAGFHTLYLRGKSTAGAWGPYESKLIFVEDGAGFNDVVEISALEYFIDTDPGPGQGASIPITTGTQLVELTGQSITTEGLSAGFHTLFVRGKSGAGAWGPYESRLIFIEAVGADDFVQIDAIEYFIDEDPGLGEGSPIAVATADELITKLDEVITTESLTPGFHTLFVRGRATNGAWGPYETRLIYIDPTDPSAVSSLVDIEYFIDTDPGVGNATSLDLTYGETSYEEMIAVATASLDVGDHTLFLRAQDETGAWGIYESHDFTIYPEVLSENFETGLPLSNSTGTFGLTSGDWDLVNVSTEDGVVNGGTAAARILNQNGELITPVFSGTSNVSFFYALPGNGEQHFKVLKSVNGGSFVEMSSQSTSSTTYQEYTAALNEGDASVRLKIQTDQSPGSDQDLLIDDFTGAAITPVLAKRYYPTNNGAEVALDSTLAVVFDQHVLEGTGNFYIVRVADSTAVQTISAGNVTINGDSVYFALSGVDYATAYGVIIDPGAVKNSNQVDFAGIQNLQTWSFTTEDAPPASIAITSPNGGENWQAGSEQTITWNTTGIPGADLIEIQLSTDGGENYTMITDGHFGMFDGAYSWTVPNSVSAAALIRIQNTTQSVSDVSDAVFAIAPGPSVTLLSPNGAEVWPVGSEQTITWSTTSIPGADFIEIQLSTDGGENYTMIADGNFDMFNGEYTWTVTNSVSSNALISIQNTTQTISDVSDAAFFIAPSCLPEGKFLGTVDSDRNNPANWCGGIVPSPANITEDIVVSGNLDISELQDFVLNGAQLVIEEGAELTIDLNSNSLILLNGATLTNSGTIIFADGTQISDPLGDFVNNGTIKGGAVFNDDFSNPLAGTLAPGFTPGCTSFEAGFTNTGTLDIEIDGVTTCDEHDQITVVGTAELGGILNVTVGYTPTDGDEIVIIDAATISGTFTTVNLPTDWTIAYDSPNVGEVSVTYTTPAGPNFFEDFATAIPASWSTNNAAYEDNPAFGYLGAQGVASIQNNTGAFLQTPLLTGLTEFSFYYRASSLSLADGAIFTVQTSTDGTNFEAISGEITKLDDTYELFEITPFGLPQDLYFRIVIAAGGDRGLLVDNVSSDGTATIVDNTAPVISAATANLVAPDLQGTATVDETGTLYYAVYSTLISPFGPSDANQLKTVASGSPGFNIIATGVTTVEDAGQPLSFSASSISPNFIFAGNEYNVYYVAEDEAGNLSAITQFLNVTATAPAAINFNTPSADDVLYFGNSLEVDFTPTGIADTDEVTFQLSTDGGSTYPYQLVSNPLSSFENGPDYFFDYTLDNPAFVTAEAVVRAQVAGATVGTSGQFSIGERSISSLTVAFPTPGKLIYDQAATISFTNNGYSTYDLFFLRPGLAPLQVLDDAPIGGTALVEYESIPLLVAQNARVQVVAGSASLFSGYFDIVYPVRVQNASGHPLSSLDFGVVDVADDDPVLSYQLELTDVEVTVTSTLPEFTVSTSPTTGFGSSVNIPAAPGVTTATIYVKFSQDDNGGDILSGTIENTFVDSNTDAIVQTVNVIGREATGSPLMVLTSPQTGNEFVSNQVINISWTSNLVDLLSVEYTVDGGVNWNLIANNLSDDLTSFEWLVPEVATNTTANIRIVDQAEVNPASSQQVAFTILPAPSITSITLINGDTQLQIDGTGFSSNAGDNEVVFPGFPDITSYPETASTNQLVVDVPDGAVSGFITVNVLNKGTVISPDQLILDGIAISPLQGQIGQSIFVNASGGVDFQAGNPAITVTFNNGGNPIVANQVNVISAEVLSVVVPEGVTSRDAITLAVEASSYTSPQEFSVQSFSFTPTTAGVFQQVTITGVNTTFLNNNTRVFVNGVEATSKSIISDTEISFTVPQGANTGRVSISTDNGFFESTADLTVDFHKITSLSATKAGRGTQVTINGSNFNNIPSTGGIKVNGVTLFNSFGPFPVINYTRLDANTITFTVPTTAVGTGKVVVIQGGVEVESPEDFTIIPRITNVSPNQAAPGAQVTISGSYFSPLDNTVYFEDNVPAAIISQNASSITVTVPQNAADGPIRVRNNEAFEEGVSTSSFDAVPAPVFTSFAPLKASAGQTVTITGQNLSNPNATSVRYNEQALSFNVVNDNTITFTVPTNFHGIGELDLTKGALTVEGPALFTVVPRINSFTLATGAVVGATVTINGNGFNPTAGSNTVTFTGGATAEIISGNNNFLTITVPSGAQTGPISVTNNAINETGTSATNFIVVPAAEIAGFAPVGGQINKTQVTISGQNFNAPNPTAVRFNGTAATFNVVSATEITATVPGITANGRITIERAGGVSQSATNFAIAPDITGLSATTLASGASLVLSGTYLSNADQVQIGTTNATITSNTNFNQIAVTVPTMTAGTYDVTVLKEGLQDVADDQLTVVPPHTISSFPSVADLGEEITITGTNLDAPQPSQVQLNGVTASIVSASGTELVVTVPSGMFNAGQGKVAITRAGLTVTSVDDLYIRPAITTDFSTTNYVVDQQVTISGTNFRFPNVTGVTINGATASFSISNDNSISVTIPDAVGTDGAIVITSPAPIGTVTAATTIDIVPRAVLSSLDKVIEAVGNTITINGSNFQAPDVSSVTINGRSTSFTVVSASEITATVPSNPLSTQGNVTITRAGLTETSAATFTMKQTISGMTPATVAQGGTVSVSGTYFTNPTAVVSIATDPVTPNGTVSFGSLSFDVPPATALGTNEIELERINNTDGRVSAGNIEIVAAHTITDTTIVSGWAARGESVILTGTNFDNSPQVLVQGISSTITGNTGTEITFTVPNGVTTGQRTITVRRAGLDVSQLATESTDLIFYIKPTITAGISAAPYMTGQSVTITGSNLAGINEVTVNDISVPIVSVLDNSLTFRLTNQSLVPLAVGTFDVKLINTAPPTDLVLTLSQSITLDAQSTIAGVTEDSAPVGGVITITGDGFTDPDVSLVNLNNSNYSSFTIVDDNTITLVVENGTGAFDDTDNIVLTRAGVALTGSDAFFVAHQIDGFRDENVQPFNPSTVRVIEGQTIYVEGNYFEGSGTITGVTVNGFTAAFTYQNDDRLQVTIPAGSAGIGKVAITRRGLEVQSAQALVISAPPTLSGITPNARIAGATISIQGSNLALPNVETVTINGASASFSVINGGNITATVPAGAAATGQVTVTTNGVTSAGVAFNVVPRIFSFTNSGLVGSEISINGSHFGSAVGTNQVFFSDGTGTNLAATITSATTDLLTVTVPNGTLTGPIRVVNTTSAQEATSSANFNLLASPDNFTLNPSSGTVASTFTIEGDNLNGTSAVSINGIPATTFDVDPDGTSIQVTVPNAATTGPVVLTKSGVDFNTGLTFSVTPKVLSFPSVATVGSEIRINGKTLIGATAVTVNGNAAAIQSCSSEFVNVLIGPDNVGIGSIEITTPSGVGTSTSTIEVKGAPAIAAFNPATGTQGDQVTITGTDLSAITFVRFNGVTASFSIISDTEIVAIVPNTETGKVSVGMSGVEVFSAADFLYTKSPNDPPAITSATATIVDASFDGNVTADKPGTLYFVALTDGQAVPGITQIKDAAIGGLTLAGQVSRGTAIVPTAFVGVDFNAAGSFALGQVYDFHFVMDDTDNNTSDVFTLSDIEAVAELAVTAPNGGQNLVIGTTATISWTSTNIPATDAIDILVSTDNGVNFTSILTEPETFESLNGTFGWQVPGTLSTEALIKVRSVTNNIEDVSDAVFSIVPVPVIDLAGANPATGLTIDDADADDLAASQMTYTVSGTNLLGPVNLAIQSTGTAGFELSSDGVNFGTTATVPAGTTGTIRVRAINTTNNGRSYNATIVHTSTSAVAINLPVEVTELLEAATLTITSPKPDTLVSGEGTIPLKWASTNLANEPVTVSYRAVVGNSFIAPQATTSGAGQFNFSIGDLPSGNYEIRVLTTQLTTNVGDTLTFGVDRTPPVVTVAPVIARNGVPSLTGTVDDIYATVEVQIEGLEPVYMATVNEDNSWVVAEEIIAPPLADGRYEIIATATDTLGNAATDESTHELIVSFNAVAAEAVNVSPFSFIARWQRALEVSGYELQVANDPDFTQPVGDFENISVEDTFLLVDAASLYHRQTYYYRVRLAYTEGGFSEFTDDVQVTLPESPALAADSLALVALYKTADGPNWRNRAGWLQNNRFDWAGVTFDGRRITALDLSDNRLLGDASSVDFGVLTALTALDLSDNDITGLGDLGGLPDLAAADLSGNRLDFGDFQAQTNIAVVNITGQQAPLEEEVAILAENEAYVFDRTIGGTGNTYRWFKDGDAIDGLISPVFTDENIGFEDEGEYHVEVRNGQFEDIVLTTNSIKVFVSSLVRDSLALVALYDHNGGEDWAGVTGWTQLPIRQWSNIQVADNRVRRVDLGGVGVTGVIPTEFATMSSVTYINLSDNAIDGLPNFTVMENLDTLVVQNNSLEFDAILKNLAIDSFNFANQAKITVEVEERIREGLDFRLAIDVDGRDLSYQWYFNGEPIPRADSTVYNIINIDFDQMGEYRCDIKNAAVSAAVPGFALSTGDFEILAIADLGGTIKTLANQPLEEGLATLYRVRPLGTPYDSVASTPIVNGIYNFEAAVLGDYLVRVRAKDLETYFPTYVEAAATWSFADTIRLRRDDKEQYDGFFSSSRHHYFQALMQMRWLVSSRSMTMTSPAMAGHWRAAGYSAQGAASTGPDSSTEAKMMR